MAQLSDLSDEDLLERVHGLSMNLFYSGGKLTLPLQVEKFFAPTVAECRRRKLEMPLRVNKFIRADDPAPVYYVSKSDKCVIRYAKLSRLRELISGKVTFTRADVLGDVTNLAQKDNEMIREWRGQNQYVTIAGYEYLLKDVKLRHELKKKSGAPAHYHMMCLSVEESPKLQRAFRDGIDGEDIGYVRIQKFQEFYRFVTQAMVNKIGGAGATSGPVNYYDDLSTISPNNLRDLIYLKQINYMYQREVRIALVDVPTEEKFITVEVKWPEGLISDLLRFDGAPV